MCYILTSIAVALAFGYILACVASPLGGVVGCILIFIFFTRT